MINRLTFGIVAVVTACVCMKVAAADGTPPSLLRVHPLPSPAALSSGEANLGRGMDGSLWMSWVEKWGEDSSALKVARLARSAVETGGTVWGQPATVASGSNWFVNWADFPAIGVTESGFMLASWLESVGEGTYAYDIRLALSNDSGRTWSFPFRLHDDTSQTEHGFVSMAPLSDQSVGVVWLDGREMANDEGPMTLRFAAVHHDGFISDSHLLDGRVCDCCQTSCAVTGNGTLVAVYRDRSDTEIRDISIVRRVGKAWSEPKPVCVDGWKIDGCPVNGPSVAAIDSVVAVAWFTMGDDDSAAVKVAFSDDHGASFAAPVIVDAGGPIGRADIVALGDGTFIVVWLEKGGDDARILARTILPTGEFSPAVEIAQTSASRASGFPRIEVSDGGAVVVVWTDVGEKSRVRAAFLTRE